MIGMSAESKRLTPGAQPTQAEDIYILMGNTAVKRGNSYLSVGE